MDPVRLGLIFPGHFVNLLAHFGFLRAMFDASQTISALRPHYICGVSAGVFPATVATTWNETFIRTSIHRALNLQMSDFGHVNNELRAWAAAGLAGSTTLLTPFEYVTSKKTRWLARVLAMGTVMGLEGGAVNRLFHVLSIFSNKPLEKLLNETLSNGGFDAIFNSDIKLELVTANINGDKAKNERVGAQLITNYLPEHQIPQILIQGIRTSSSIPAFFEPWVTKDGTYSDGAVYSNTPVRLALNQGCNVIVIPYHQYAGQGYLERKFHSWMGILQRSFDIVVDSNSEKVLLGYLRVNRDLKNNDKQKRRLDSIRCIIDQCTDDIDDILLPHLQQALDDLQAGFDNYSFSHKKIVRLVIVKSPRILPALDFRHFTREQNELGFEIGRESFRASEEEIIEAIRWENPKAA